MNQRIEIDARADELNEVSDEVYVEVKGWKMKYLGNKHEKEI